MAFVVGIKRLKDLVIDTAKDWLGYGIKNVGSPVDATDAARKAEVDAKVNKAGDTMSGELSIRSVPIYKRLEHIPALILGNEDWTPLVYAASVGIPVYSAADRGVLVSGISNWFRVRVRMPVDPESLYFVRAKVKKKSGNGTFYIGAISLDENYNELSTDQARLYNYFGALGVSIAAGSTYYAEGTISGYNATTEGSHNKFDPEAKYFDLVIICNYRATTTPTETVIEWLELYKAPNVVYSGALTITNGRDLHLRAVSGSTDSGDVIFEDGNGSEVARIWQASGELNTRFNIGPTYKIWHAGNFRAPYAGDETEVSVSGTTETLVKTLRVVKCSANGLNVTALSFVATLKVTGGTGYLRIYIDNTLVLTLSTTSTSYVVVHGNVAVSWGDNTVHTIDVKMYNSGAYVTYNQVFEVYVK